jgi:hypothetical protein
MTREGPLSDAAGRQELQKAEARARRLNTDDLFYLERDAVFRRWFGKWAVPLLFLDLNTTNGGTIQHFMGKRSQILDMLREFEEQVPGFYERVMGVRRSLDNELRQMPQEEKQDGTDEDG